MKRDKVDFKLTLLIILWLVDKVIMLMLIRYGGG